VETSSTTNRNRFGDTEGEVAKLHSVGFEGLIWWLCTVETSEKELCVVLWKAIKFSEKNIVPANSGYRKELNEEHVAGGRLNLSPSTAGVKLGPDSVLLYPAPRRNALDNRFAFIPLPEWLVKCMQAWSLRLGASDVHRVAHNNHPSLAKSPAMIYAEERVDCLDRKSHTRQL
jgi:hypothetical protein